MKKIFCLLCRKNIWPISQRKYFTIFYLFLCCGVIGFCCACELIIYSNYYFCLIKCSFNNCRSLKMNPDNIYSIEFDFIGFDQEELENYITFDDNGELPQLVNEENQLQTGGSELFQSNTKKIKGRGKATDWVLKSNFSSKDSFKES